MQCYSQRTLFRGYKNLQRSAIKVLKNYLDSNTSEEVNKLTLSLYPEVSKKVPYIGGLTNPLTSTLVFSAQLLPYIIVLKTKGLEPDTIGQIIYEIGQKTVESFNPVLIKAGKAFFFTSMRLSMLSKRAEESKNREYPGNWVYSFRRAARYQYHLDYHECGIHKLYKELGYSEFVKYLCKLDFLMDEKLGVRLERTKTIGNGDDVCDFIYHKKNA